MTPATLAAPVAGRRKEAVARVRLLPGSGRCLVNGRPVSEYFDREPLARAALHALVITNTAGQYDVTARVVGGGKSGQADALQLAIARALAAQDEGLRVQLRREGLLTRDARAKERKKYGQPGARKRFQFSKR
jgi:small subunit ribosomal protein S9